MGFSRIALVLLPTVLNATGFVAGWAPSEGTPILHAKKTLDLYQEPANGSVRVKGDRIRKGDLISYAETKNRTISSGIIKVISAMTVTGHSFGTVEYLANDNAASPVKEFSFLAGDRVEYLQYRGEGFAIVKIGTEVAEIPLPDAKHVVIEKPPRTEWWVSVMGNEGRIRGWVQVDKNISISRKFR